LAVWLAAAACARPPRRHQATPARPAQAAANNVALPNPPRVSLNTATQAELERLPGIGPALAARIIEHRQRYGPFRRAEHVMMVRGIGDLRFRQMRPYVTAE
jgi:competence protein ComEA